MPYKIAICDDAEADRSYLSDLIRQWAARKNHMIQISTFSSSESFLFQYADENDFQILLLDIEMGAMDGITMAKQLRQTNDSIQIVFVTGYSDYIAEGYEVEALHYLMKPVKEEKFFSVLDRAVEKLGKNEQILNLESGGELVRIPIYQIRFIDVQKNYVTIHAKEDYTEKKTLQELSEELDERFFRAGRSVIVNLTFIRKITRNNIFLNDGTSIPLPRGAYEKVNRAIIEMR